MPLGPAVVRRRPAEFRKVLQAASATGAATILFGPRARRLAADDALWLECPVDGANAFDSYAAAMSLVSVLANSVLLALGRAGRERVREVTGLFDSLGEIEAR
jgi:DNA-binding MurR/RpiR family transcriptional regulator